MGSYRTCCINPSWAFPFQIENMKTNLFKFLSLLVLLIALVDCIHQQSGVNVTAPTQIANVTSATTNPPSIVNETPIPNNCIIVGCPLKLLPTDLPLTKTSVPRIQEAKYARFDLDRKSVV